MASAGSPCENNLLFFRQLITVLPGPILARKVWTSKNRGFAFIRGLCPKQESGVAQRARTQIHLNSILKFSIETCQALNREEIDSPHCFYPRPLCDSGMPQCRLLNRQEGP